MPRKKQKEADIDMDALKEEFLSQAAALWDGQVDNMTGILERSETQKLGIGFHVGIDNSEANVKIETRIAFGEKYSDEKVSQLDPDQEKFSEVLEAAKGSKKSSKKDDSVDDSEDSE